jgi:hypothetical protein
LQILGFRVITPYDMHVSERTRGDLFSAGREPGYSSMNRCVDTSNTSSPYMPHRHKCQPRCLDASSLASRCICETRETESPLRQKVPAGETRTRQNNCDRVIFFFFALPRVSLVEYRLIPGSVDYLGGKRYGCHGISIRCVQVIIIPYHVSQHGMAW